MMQKIWYKFARLLVQIGFKVLYRHKTVRLGKVYKGGAIVAPNHVSHLDPIAVGIS